MNVFIFCVVSFFGIDITEDCHVKNEPPGYCSWACLETLGRVHKIRKLENLMNSRKSESDLVFVNQFGQTEVHRRNFGYDYAINKKLNDLGVTHWMQFAGTYDRKLLKYTKSHGCMVTMRSGAFQEHNFYHSVILLEINSEFVEFYDSNYPKIIRKCPRNWFDYYWNGSIVIVKK